MSTQLTYYICKNRNCDYNGIPYQLREDDKSKLIIADAVNCSGCGKPRTRDKSTTVVES